MCQSFLCVPTPDCWGGTCPRLWSRGIPRIGTITATITPSITVSFISGSVGRDITPNAAPLSRSQQGLLEVSQSSFSCIRSWPSAEQRANSRSQDLGFQVKCQSSFLGPSHRLAFWCQCGASELAPSPALLPSACFSGPGQLPLIS